jgi:hypothetical protein
MVNVATNAKAHAVNGISRRSALRGGLLAGIAITTAGAASVVRTGTAKAAIANPQPGWVWCNACAGLWYTLVDGGACPGTGGVHNIGPGSFKYLVYNDEGNTGGNPQGGWNWCLHCAGLFTTLHTPSYCYGNNYGSGPHVLNDSADYYLFYDIAGSDPQPYWRWCDRCQLLYYQGSSGTYAGRCPTGGDHTMGSDSYNYAIDWNGSY